MGMDTVVWQHCLCCRLWARISLPGLIEGGTGMEISACVDILGWIDEGLMDEWMALMERGACKRTHLY